MFELNYERITKFSVFHNPIDFGHLISLSVSARFVRTPFMRGGRNVKNQNVEGSERQKFF
jgi:hypothetical protein